MWLENRQLHVYSPQKRIKILKYKKMNRVKWKGPYTEKNLLEKVKNSKLIPNTSIKTMLKNSVILPSFIERTFRVYNGKAFTIVKIIDEMVGHKLGEFVSTKKQFSYKKTKNK